MDDNPLSLKEVARAVGLGYERTRQLVSEGTIAAYRPGGERGQYRVERAEVERLKRTRAERR